MFDLFSDSLFLDRPSAHYNSRRIHSSMIFDCSIGKMEADEPLAKGNYENGGPDCLYSILTDRIKQTHKPMLHFSHQIHTVFQHDPLLLPINPCEALFLFNHLEVISCLFWVMREQIVVSREVGQILCFVIANLRYF